MDEPFFSEVLTERQVEVVNHYINVMGDRKSVV